MSLLKFDAAALGAHIAHARASKPTKAYNPLIASLGVSDTVGLWLVGDQGVYIMSAGSNDGRPDPVYAEGINPDVDAFEDWWARKRATFGKDDGVEELPDEWLGQIEDALKEGATTILVRVETDQVVLHGYQIEEKRV